MVRIPIFGKRFLAISAHVCRMAETSPDKGPSACCRRTIIGPSVALYYLPALRAASRAAAVLTRQAAPIGASRRDSSVMSGQSQSFVKPVKVFFPGSFPFVYAGFEHQRVSGTDERFV